MKIPRPPYSPRKNIRGFTLIELLTVIVIIGILAAILIPIISHVRSSAHKATCLSNMRQIGVATATYVSDNRGHMPWLAANGQLPTYRHVTDKALFSQLIPYLSLKDMATATAVPEQMICPSYISRYPDWASNGGAKYNVYLANQDQEINGERVFGSQSSTLGNPYGGMKYLVTSGGTGKTTAANICYIEDGSPEEYQNPVHGSTRNYLFLDFHVQNLPARTLNEERAANLVQAK